MTISLKHDMKLTCLGSASNEGLLPCFDALNPTAASDADIPLYWILPEARYHELVRSKEPSFPLTLADEVAAKPEVKQAAELADKLKKNEAALKRTAANTPANAAAAKARDDVKAELDTIEKTLAPRRAAWAALKQRVRHHAVCLQFSMTGGLKTPTPVGDGGAAAATTPAASSFVTPAATPASATAAAGGPASAR